MKRYFLLVLSLVIFVACSSDDSDNAEPLPLVEPQLILNDGDDTILYNYQSHNRIYVFYYEDSNPDSIIVDYRIRFSAGQPYLALAFFKSFAISDLDNEFSKDYPSGYELSEQEMLAVFAKGTHYTVDHEVNLVGGDLIRPSNGVNLNHFEFLYFDADQSRNIYKEFGTSESEESHFEIREITQLTLDNHSQGSQDSDLTPSLFKVFDTIYAINGIFSVPMYNKETSEIEVLESPEFTFVVYTDEKEF